jgi:DNA-binding NarL/FixJ family response regulator
MPLVTILIEDSAMIRESLIPALAEVADVDVVAVAETAAEGIAAVASLGDRWRLAVVDLFLREGNGFEVLRAGRSRGANQRMVVLTNFATADIRRRVSDAGADAVFDKSTELDLFFELCRKYAASV